MANSALQNVAVVNTRPPHQADELTNLLKEQGAHVLHYPAIAIQPPRQIEPLDEALRMAASGGYEWLILTSVNTVYALAERLDDLSIDSDNLNSLRVAAIGSSTAAAAEERLGLSVEFVPDEFVAESLLEGLSLQAGSRVFLPQSALARPVLAEGLSRAGATVTAVTAYRTVIGSGGDDVPTLFWRGHIDAVLFTSTSTVHQFIKRLKYENGTPGMLVDVIVGCIGPVTADAARAHDLPVKVVPSEHTVRALVDALADYFSHSHR